MGNVVCKFLVFCDVEMELKLIKIISIGVKIRLVVVLSLNGCFFRSCCLGFYIFFCEGLWLFFKI